MRSTVLVASFFIILATPGCRTVSDYVAGPSVDDDVVMAISEIKSENESWASIIKGKYAETEKTDGYYKAVELYITAKGSSDKLVDGIVVGLEQNKSARLVDYYSPIKEAQRENPMS